MSRRQRSLYDSLRIPPMKDEESEHNWKLKAVKILQTLISDKLTWRQKQIIMLYYYKGLSQRDIARMLGVSESSVSHTKHTALKKLSFYMDILRR